MDEGLTKQTIENHKEFSAHTKRRKFVVLAACFMIQFIVATPFAMGEIYVTLLHTFETNKAETSLVQSLNLGMTHMVGLVAGPLQEVYGPRYLLLLGGIMSTVGFCSASFVNSVPAIAVLIGIFSGSSMAILNVISMAAPPQYFQKAHNALAITSAGCSVGATLIPVIISWLMNSFGWRGCFLLFAGFHLQVCVFAMAFDVKIKKKNQKSKKICKTNLVELMANRLYLVFLIIVVFIGMTTAVTNILLMDFALEKGFSRNVSTSFLVAVGVSSCFGRFLFPALKNFKLSDHTIYIITITLMGVFTALLPSSNNLYVCYTLVICVGLLIGMFMIGSHITLLNLVGPDIYGFAFGIVSFMTGIGFFSAGPWAGFVADLTNSYNLTFLISGGLAILVGLIYHVAAIIDKRYPTKKRKQKEAEIAAAATAETESLKEQEDSKVNDDIFQ